MGDGKRPRGLPPEKWAEIRACYEKGDSVLSLSKRFGVRRQTIMARAKREAWTAQPKAHVSGPEVQKAAQARVIDMVTRKAVDAASESVAEFGVEIAAELVATKRASRLAAEYAIDILERAKNGEIRPASGPGEQTEADVFKAVMAGYATYSKIVREHAGITPGRPTLGGETEEEAPVDNVVVVVREPKSA